MGICFLTDSVSPCSALGSTGVPHPRGEGGRLSGIAMAMCTMAPWADSLQCHLNLK